MAGRSTEYHDQINRVSGGSAPVLLVEITHPDLAVPVRLVNDTQDFVHLANTFTALAFMAALPDDLEQGLPRAELRMDNVGKELMQWLEISGGGKGATCRFVQVMRALPDTVEWEATLSVLGVRATTRVVTATLGYDDVLNLPAVAITYRPDNTPGLF